EPKEVQETLDSVRKERTRSPWRPVSFLLGYRNLSESGFSGGKVYDGNLLGGNIVSPELAWNVPLRQSGERSANKALLDTKVRAVEMQLSAIQDDLRNEFETLRVLSTGYREKLLIARQKRDLSIEGMALASVRFQNGLGSPSSVSEAEKVALLAETDFVRTSYQLKAGVYSVLVLCGAHQQPVQQQARVLRGQFAADGSGF
ncbi:MAG: TolC family protein, partial [Acidobacteria bacterium]|nr:TolC family protein [Acidobacteriota bacterium]